MIAALVLGAGFLVAFRRNLDSKVVGGVAAVAVIALVAGGVAAALSGEREIHPHETIEDVAAAGECGPEEIEADDNASQTVVGQGQPVRRAHPRPTTASWSPPQLDVPGETSTLTFQRSNPTNVLFVNESDEERRLVLEYQVRVENEDTGQLEAVPASSAPPSSRRAAAS